MNVEAEESDTPDDDDDDENARNAERARQASECVPLRKRDEVDKVLQVAKKWEEYTAQGELERQEDHCKPPRKKCKQTADSPVIPRLRKCARVQEKSPSPPPNTFPVKVETCRGVVVIHVPEIPGEQETPCEMRIYNLSEPYHRAADQELLAELRSKQRHGPATFSANPTSQSPTLADSSHISTPGAASSSAVTEEWIGGALTPISASTPPPRSPAASRARSLSLLLKDWPTGVATPAYSRSPPKSPATLPLFLPDDWDDHLTPAPSPPSADAELGL